MVLQFVETKQAGESLIVNGFKFNHKSKQNEKVYPTGSATLVVASHDAPQDCKNNYSK